MSDWQAISVEEFQNDYDWKEAIDISGIRKVPGTSVSDADFDMSHVVEVIRASVGENDGPNWIALLRLADGRFACVSAGCDYTGWDCQASGAAYVGSTLQEIARFGLDDRERDRLDVSVDGDLR